MKGLAEKDVKIANTIILHVVKMVEENMSMIETK